MIQLLTEWWEWSDGPARLQALLLLLIGSFLLGGAGLLVNVLVLMRRREREQRREAKLRELAEDAIAAWMSGDMDDEALSRHFHRFVVQSRLNRRVVTDILYSTSKLLRGESQEPLQLLFRSLGLDRYCLKTLRQGVWHRQAYAARVLSQMQIHESIPVIWSKLNTQEMMLRIELISALAAFGDFSGLQRVEHSGQRLSDWEQLLLLERFRALELTELPPFENWLRSSEADWVLFGVRLCRYFNRLDKIVELGDLLGNPDERVQGAILDAFEYLGSPEVVEPLLAYVESAVGECLLRTLRLLGRLSDEEVVPLLMAYAVHADDAVRHTALHALRENFMAEEELLRLTGATHADNALTPSVS
ncbi:HEAT repeat domain-containing protein [Tellurirhabdus rosea]|uniref:HEAT repeat domain-containing protein n=1 Tax=Tellurirhabdus rosea TaxID=2674997 RepID=UPI002250BC6B|nr:HEAT repeat domain-containing protein [Tellurirhabdus rosea]